MGRQKVIYLTFLKGSACHTWAQSKAEFDAKQEV